MTVEQDAASAVAANASTFLIAYLEAASTASAVAVSVSVFVRACFEAAPAASAESVKAFYDGIVGSGTVRMLAMLQPHGVSLVSPDVDTAHIPVEQ